MPTPFTASRSIALRSTLEGVVLGAAYGLFLRLLGLLPRQWLTSYNNHILFDASIVMTVGFICFGPAFMGLFVVRRAGATRRLPVWQWFVLPWLAVFAALTATLLLQVEGRICLIFALPVMLAFSSIGGIVAGLENHRHLQLSSSTTACLAFLPILLAISEPHLVAPVQIRTVQSQVRIHAPASVVWQNIERVRTIAPAELHNSWAQRIGFPRPVEATLSFEGIGGVRHASFERGLLFVETVTAWEPQHRLAFSIRADTEHLPPTTLDEHVTIGGRYFDVLDGQYALEPLPDGDVLLHLTSRQRLSTDFNGYAGLWSDAVMQNLQNSILAVIQHRCESDVHGGAIAPRGKVN